MVASPATGAAPRAAPAAPDQASASHFFWQNARAVARARLLLAIGNALVVYLDPSLPLSREPAVLLTTYGTLLLLVAYAVWVWRREAAPDPPAYLPRLATWLDVLFSATLIAGTGAPTSPFFMWNVFTLVGCALKNDRRTVLHVCLAQILLYVAICAPYLGDPSFRLGVFLVRTSYLFVIALVLAFMGQQLLQQNHMLTRLQRAAMHLCAGRSTPDILARVADSLTDLLEVEQVAAAVTGSQERGIPPRFINLSRRQGEALLQLAQERVSTAPQSRLPLTLVSNDLGKGDPLPDWGLRIADCGLATKTGLSCPAPLSLIRNPQSGVPSGPPNPAALTGIRNMLIARLPGSRRSPGVLVACNRQGERGFTTADRELIELLAAQAGPLLETAHLQEQRRYHAGIDERRRIAGELHDRLIQTLASMDLRIMACEESHRTSEWERLGGELRTLKQLAEEALEEARGAISELAPVRLREEGIGVYLEDCLAKFQERAAMPVRAAITLDNVDVPEPTALLLIGLLREGLNNVRKHAAASQIELAITRSGDQIQFRLTDDGVGFAPEQGPLRRTPTRQYGLAYLRERVTAMGGELHVRSHPGRGATLEARVPLLTEERVAALFSQAEH